MASSSIASETRARTASSLALSALLSLLGACDAFSDPPEGDDDGFAGFDSGGGASSPGFVGPATFDAGRACRPCPDGGGACACGEREQPTPWRPPLSDLGGDGWRQSEKLLCAGVQQISGLALWSDGGSVFVAVSGFGGPLNASTVPEDDAGVVTKVLTQGEFAQVTRVLHNDGRAWGLRAALEGSTAVRLAAASPSRVFVYGDGGQAGRACTLGLLDGKGFDCAPQTGAVLKVQAVSKTRALALTQRQALLVHDGTEWAPFEPQLPASARDLWAGDDELIVVGNLGNVHRLSNGAWATENIGDDISAIWGRNGDDVWAGTSDGRLLHFQGSGWEQVAQLGGVTCARRSAIEHISGGAEHVWLQTATQIARWNGSELETFANWTCAPTGVGGQDDERIDDLIAVADDDVYIAFSNRSTQSSCGDAFVVHYDGDQFHRF